MAPSHSFNILSLVLTILLLPFTWARPWIVTEAYEQVRVTEYDYYYETEDPTITTSIQEIQPTISPLPEALSTITSIDSSSDVTIIQKLYPTSVGTPVYYNYYDDDTDEYHYTVYVVNITYTAPTSCSSDWTTTSAVPVYPPDGVESLLPTTARSTSVSVDDSEPFSPTTYTYDYIFVEPTQVPSDTYSYLSSEYYPATMEDTCGYPYNSDSSSSSSSSSSNSDCTYYYGCSGYWDESDNWWFDSYWMGISPFALVMILTFGWIGIWLIAGFIEAWVRFRRLMLGWQTRRGLPLCWAFTILPLTLLFIIAWRKGFRPRSQADAAELRKQWDSYRFGKKLKLFFVWGFRYKYPTVLGEAPMPVNMRTRPSKKPGDVDWKQPRESLLSPPQPMVQVEASGALNGQREVPREGLSEGPSAGPSAGHLGSEGQPEAHSEAHSEGQPAVRPAGDSDDIGRAA
ncbi:hypothetical protein N7478_012047 [Penicillium angulare]|uniref:uncharacterized protein n=1 Tax=Penicillium angulare TaxID=116970 RepID=UPI002540132A|nr:uncharacterized protein N7478_012047 [Penicillium angulare]KAJ5261452.1 hypothetical protein N7478_012047 [Penicillium angulare]